MFYWEFRTLELLPQYDIWQTDSPTNCFSSLAICSQSKRTLYQVPAILLTAKREGRNKLTFRSICLL